MSSPASVIVAGHICLDIIPTFPCHGSQDTASSKIEPGRLYLMGPAQFSTGGAVSNTGMALQRLGISTTLMGKIADDLFGSEVLNILNRRDPALAAGMIVSQEGHTSYSVVISPPAVDRSFLHCPGANDTFSAADVNIDNLQAGQIFHFGYPPLMQHFYAKEGEEMLQLFSQAQARGLVTSLDMAMPDPRSASGQIDWKKWLARVLPAVDLFLPSIEEILFMLGYDDLQSEKATMSAPFPMSLLHEVSGELLAMGAGVVLLKLGEQGLYLRTGKPQEALLKRIASIAPQYAVHWSDRELYAPCFQVEVAGTTGAGDCTIAGFLAGFAHGQFPEQTLSTAVGVGACSVEAADSTSGIVPLPEVQKRITAGWSRQQPAGMPAAWQWHESLGVWASSSDSLYR